MVYPVLLLEPVTFCIEKEWR